MDLHDLLKKQEDLPLSLDDMFLLTKNRTNIVLYHDLATVADIRELFTDSNSLIILYEFNSNTGHYVCLTHRPELKQMDFFNSYGLKPDQEIELYRDKTPWLSILLGRLRNFGYSISINKYQLQIFKEHINTCGRWAILRSLFPERNHLEFVQWISSIHKSLKGLSNDEIVTLMTISIGLGTNSDDSDMK